MPLEMTTGELAVRVVAMPADANPDGDVFGGWILSQMDLAAWVHARKITTHRIVTVAIDNIVFHKPVYVGDCILCYVATEKVGRTSITVKVNVMVERRESYEVDQVTEGRFVYVAIGADRTPIPVNADTP
jgi:acyl-CoA thioesterase YciA